MSTIASAKLARHYRPAPHCAACVHFKVIYPHGKASPKRECTLGGFYVSSFALCDDFKPLHPAIYDPERT